MRDTGSVIRRILPILLGAVGLLVGGAPAPAAPSAVNAFGNDSPAWAPDGNRIAFTSFRNGLGDIYVMRPDGSDQHQLTTNPAYDDLAAWSPEATRIVFASNRNGSLQIWVMNADGSDQKQLTFAADTNYFPTWSPDGSRIAFRSDRDGEAEIYSMRPDGSDQRRLTNSGSSDYSPAWGPDGRIVFVSNRETGAKTSLWIMDGDGGDQHRLTPRTFVWNERSPAWSPDGTRILFQADRDVPLGNTELYAMRVDGSELTRLTAYPGQDNWPTWSPDGTQIAFARGPTPYRNEIYVMNADGSHQRELTLPKLRGLQFGTIPANPSAGRPVTVVYDVGPRSGGDVGRASVTCSARLGPRLLIVRSRRFTGRIGRAACVWRLPSVSRGKYVRGTIAVHAPTGTISQRFVFLVR